MGNQTIKKDLENLAVAQALYNSLGEFVSTKEGDSLRNYCQGYLVEEYQNVGTDRVRVEMDGENVATLSLRFSKAEKKPSVTVTDREAFIKFLKSKKGAEFLERLVMKLNPKDLTTICELQGWEIPAGCKHTITEQESLPIGTTFKVDTDKVFDALRKRREIPYCLKGLLAATNE